jgi:hypothetical protein
MAEIIIQTLEERTELVSVRITHLKRTHPEYTEREVRIEAIKQLLEENKIIY